MTRATTTAVHVRPEDFRHRAVCRDVGDAEIFFPIAERGPEHDEQVCVAKAVCASCPVLAQCREWALASLPDGIAGGMTEQERRHERRRHTRRGHSTASPHDTATAEGSQGGNRAPLQISHTHALTGTRAAEGHRS